MQPTRSESDLTVHFSLDAYVATLHRVVLALALEEDRLRPDGQGTATVQETARSICARLHIGNPEIRDLAIPQVVRDLIKKGFLPTRDDRDGAFG